MVCMSLLVLFDLKNIYVTLYEMTKINLFNILITLIVSISTDLNVTSKPCCEVSSTNSKGQCDPYHVPCSNRQNYVFWDAFHPTERVSVIDGIKAHEILSPLYTSETISSSEENETGYVSDV